MSRPPLTIDQALSRAKAHAKCGDLEGARGLYLGVLNGDPGNKKAKKGLKAVEQQLARRGPPAAPPLSQAAYEQLVALISAGRAEQAAGEAQRLADSHPNDPLLPYLHGSAEATLGRQARAAAAFRAALALNPDFAEAWNNLGNALDELDEREEAIDCYRRALVLHPHYADAHYNLGCTLHAAGELEEAIEHFRRTLAIQPDYAKAHNNLANALRERGELEEALASYRRALAFDPAAAATHSNAGVVLCALDRLDEAEEAFRRALAIDPQLADAHCNLGDLLRKQGRPVEAVESCRRAIAINPEGAAAYTNLGNALSDQGRLEEAIERYRQALARDPEAVDAHANLALCLLLRGDYEEGWREYEWRLRKDDGNLTPPAHLPRWDGAFDFADELILIHEQGLGDTLQFLRYGVALKERLPRVSLALPEKLVGIAAQAGLFDHIYRLPLNPAEHSPGARWAPLMSIPGRLGVRVDDPVVSAPYLRSDPARDAVWRERLRRPGEWLIGLNWQGNPDSERLNLSGRSLPLATFQPLAEIPGIRLVSLQKGFGAEQLASCPFRERFVDAQQAVDEAWDFRDNAAILMNCDLLISSDTAVVHLAGGLGCPTWVLLHPTPDWRWGRDGDRTPWYPGVRLFRQGDGEGWPAVVERVRTALSELV
ncbi:tetratricopeptide repeat protein, partial [Endothiovibrio diazotrophicus]